MKGSRNTYSLPDSHSDIYSNMAELSGLSEECHCQEPPETGRAGEIAIKLLIIIAEKAETA